MKIEIIIPAYNCTKTLHRTLSSLECQTDTDFLVHVVDDCSTEDLSHIIDMHKTLNIRVTRNKKNLGCGMTRQVIGHWVVFWLGGWSPLLPTGFLVSRGTLDTVFDRRFSPTRLSLSSVRLPIRFG